MPSVQLLFGPMLIGAFMNTLLYGVMIMQMFIYLQTYKRDPSWIRYFILYLFIAETVNSGCDIYMLYEPLIQKYGTPDATTFFPLMLAADPILTVFISTPIQIFIAWRIRVISKSTILAVAICLLALVSLGGGTWLTVVVIQLRTYANKPKVNTAALCWLVPAMVCDIIITISLSVTLARRKTGFSRTDDAIDRISRLTIQTGLVTSIFAVLDVVCFLVFPAATINFVWDFALSKLYTNALLSTLNARAGWSKLANGHGANNVLFGNEWKDGTAKSQAQTTTTSTFSPFDIQLQRALQQSTQGDTPTFELQPQRRAREKTDEEYGISVTREVSTLRDIDTRKYMTQ